MSRKPNAEWESEDGTQVRTELGQPTRSKPIRVKSQEGEPPKPYLVALTGQVVGRTYQLGAGRHLVGRAADSDIPIEDEGVSRRHAMFVCSPDGEVVLEDLGSTNGTAVNDQLVDVRRLEGGERLGFGSDTVYKFEFRDSLEEQYASFLYESATQDGLTGVFNERFLRDQLRVEFAWHRRHREPLTLIFLDIDHFKRVNDEFGHLTGDSVLRQVAERCVEACRTEDIVARYGGEEFACLLRQTDVEKGALIAERMRHSVEATPFDYKGIRHPKELTVTISAGVAQLASGATDVESLLEEADRLLYAAKRAGRNRIEAGPIVDL